MTHLPDYIAPSEYSSWGEFIEESNYYDSLDTDSDTTWLGEVNEDIDIDIDRERLLSYFAD